MLNLVLCTTDSRPLVEQLVAGVRQHIESRLGSGFYVAAAPLAEAACERTGTLERAVDVANLIDELVSDEARAAFKANRLLAGGCLPNDWQEESGIRRYARQVASSGTQLTDFGTKLGFPPLREFLSRRLADLGIGAAAPQILLTAGATHAFDLIIRYLVSP